jgi:putative lipoic acid-binding regulatory protein
MSDKNDFYEKLKERLDATTTFPSKYLYKFIVPADELKVKEIESIFNYGGAIIDTKSSKKGKYTSVSILIEMQNSNEIISKYKLAEKVEGIISL